MKALKIDGEIGNGAQYFRYAFGIDAELLRATAHLHSRTLEFEVGVDANGDARWATRLRADFREHLEFAFRLDVDGDVCGSGFVKLAIGLAGSGHADSFRIDTRI